MSVLLQIFIFGRKVSDSPQFLVGTKLEFSPDPLKAKIPNYIKLKAILTCRLGLAS